MKYCCIFFVLAAMAIINFGCTVSGKNYYNDSVSGNLSGTEVDLQKFKTPAGDRTPVILIHGLWGAELRDTAENKSRVWGDFSCFAPTAERKFSAMALLPDSAEPAASLAATGILKSTEVDFFGLKFDMANYSGVIDLLQAAGYVPEKSPLPENSHYSTLFVYYYDWRKSIDENAAGLADFIEEKKEYLTRQFRSCPKHRNKDVRFDLLGHSMGGLIARYYVEYGKQKLGSKNDALPQRSWDGAGNVRKLIMAATPHDGYVDILRELVNGVRFDPLAPGFPAEVLATFQSCYQLLPDVSRQTVRFAESGQAVDIFDIRVWKKYQWGLLADTEYNNKLLARMFPNLPSQERYAAAAEYVSGLLDKAGRFKLLFSRPLGVVPEPLKYYRFAAGGVETNSTLEVDDKTGAVKVCATAPGDGKVTLRSAGFEHSRKENPLICSDTYILDGGHLGFMSSSLFACNLALVLYSEL